MFKGIIREIVIVVLLFIAVALVLGILFYDYIPTNKTVPQKVEPYKMSEEVAEELANEISDQSQIIVKTYTIDSRDLDLYESIKDYNKGKENPFSLDKSKNVVNNEISSGNEIENNNIMIK